jgi:hypothetical protein
MRVLVGPHTRPATPCLTGSRSQLVQVPIANVLGQAATCHLEPYGLTGWLTTHIAHYDRL